MSVKMFLFLGINHKFLSMRCFNLVQVVLSCVEGSPAARAGIHDGDELIEINGMHVIKPLTLPLPGLHIIVFLIYRD